MSRLSTGSRRSSSASVTSRPGSRLSISHPNADLEIGDAVIVTSSGLAGAVRYSGPTEFSNGHWIGLELELEAGKNDGSVDEIRYFTCKQGHGIFIRAAQLQLVSKTRAGTKVLSRSVDQEPDQSNGFYNSHRYADSSSVPVMKKTKAVSPRLTRSRAAKSAAATAIEEIAPVKNSRSKSSAVDTKRVRAGSKSKFNQMELEDIKEAPTLSKLRGMSTKPSEVETDPFSSKLKGPSRLPSASSSQIDTQSSETRKLSVRRKAGTSAAIATTEIVNPLAEEPATTSKSFPENEGANLALSSEAAPALNNSIFNSKSLSSHQLANTDAVDLELSVQRPFETPSKPKLASGIPSSITKLLPDDFYPFVDRVRMRRSSSSEHQSSADVDIVPKSRASSAQILGKTVKAPPTIQNLEQFESIRAEVVQQLKENDLAFNPDITKLQDTGIESAYSSNRLSISGIPTPSKRKPTIESETPLEAPKSSFNPIYDDARIDSLLAKKNTTRTEPHLTPTKKSTSLKPVLTNLENIGESLSLQKVSPALKQSVVNLLLQPQIVESSTTSPLTVPEIIPVKKGLEDWESRILETGSFPSSLSSFDRQGLDHLDSSSNDNSETKAAILQGSLHQNHAHLLPVEIFLSKDYPNVNELSPKISISKSATSSRPPTPKKPKTPSPEKAFKKLTRQSTLENEEIFAISDERPSNDSVSKNSPISQNISLSVESETLSKFENMDEDALRVQLMKFYHKNVLLTNEKAQIEKTISNMNAKHGEEIFELKKSLEDRSHIDTVRQSFNALLEKYESAKLDIENSRLYQEKLQKELKQAKKELHLLQAENDFSKDSAEMSVIDKCVLEEQLETMKEEMQILADRNEELSLQIELQLSKPTNSNADNWADKHQLVVLNSRLSEALVKLRDVALAREEELKDKIKIKDLDISRLNDLSDTQLSLKNKLETANEHINFLKAQLDASKDSNQLIAALTESNLNLDENLAKKTLETLELEQLRKINNDLEEAHKVLESHLYRDLQLKENIIEELASRYNSQKSNLLQQSEQLKNLLKEKALFENKPKSSTRDQAEIELLKQNVRVLQTNADEKKVQLERFKIDFAGAKDETQLLLDCVENILDSSTKKRIQCYFSSKIIVRRCKLLLKTYTIPEIPACQLILNLYNCATALQIISEYDGVTGDSILDLPVSGNVISILDEVISKLEMGDSVSVSANLLNVTWFVEKCLLISNVFFTSKTITSLKCCAIFDFVGLQSEVITRLAGLCTTFSDIQKGATRLNHVSNQVFCRIAEQLGHGRSLGRTQYEELLLAQKNFSIIFDDLMELFENDNQNDGSSQKIIKLETSLETIRLKFESFLNVEMELQAKPVSLWTLSAENLKSKVNRVDHLQKSLSLLETKYAVEKQKFDEKLGADMLKVEFLERKLDSLKAEVYKMKKELEAALELKNTYVQALEAAHADLKDAEVENEELRRASQTSYSGAHGSPRKGFASDQLSRAAADEYVDVDTQRNSIRYLLAENSKLRAAQYANMVSDIFSPSDPVMILASQKSRPRVESELKSIQELEVRARKLSANFTSSFPKLVDITKEGKADGKDLLKPVIEHQQNAAIFGKECSMLQNSINEIRSNLCIPEIVKYEDFGRIELPVAKGFPSQPNRTINLLDLDQLKLVHHALII